MRRAQRIVTTIEMAAEIWYTASWSQGQEGDKVDFDVPAAGEWVLLRSNGVLENEFLLRRSCNKQPLAASSRVVRLVAIAPK